MFVFHPEAQSVVIKFISGTEGVITEKNPIAHIACANAVCKNVNHFVRGSVR